MKGTIVGSYRILGTISVGGMGTVYRAEHTLIGRLAAIKILHPELCANRSIVNRFFNEAKTTSSLKHPGIVEVFDFGYMPSGHAYLIMELIDGAPLSHRIRARGKMPEGEAAMLLRGVCIALSAAHDKGIVHRDLKPDNIIAMPDPDGPSGARIKLLDFGIAKLTDIGLNGSATRTGSVMGTPTYMSPEQCRGTGDVDCRADLYSIGCIYYEMVAGRPPFVRTGAGEAIGSHLFVDPEPPSRHVAGLSAETEALIMKLLAKQPEQRVQTARELAQLLARIAQQHGWLPAGDVSRPSPSAGPETVAPAAVPGETNALPTHALPGETHALPGETHALPGETHALPGETHALRETQLPTDVLLRTDSPTTIARPTSTLSGAASEVTEPPRRSRSLLRFAIAGVLAMVVGGLGAALTFSGPSREPPSPAAIAPAAGRASAPEPAPAGAVELRAPAPEPARAPITPPPAARPVPADNPAQQTANPVVVPRSAAPAPTALHPPAVTPAAKPRRPARKIDKAAGSASDDKELLEQDI